MLDEKILLEIEQRANAAIRKWRTGDNYSGDWSLIEKSIPSLIIECRRLRKALDGVAGAAEKVVRFARLYEYPKAGSDNCIRFIQRLDELQEALQMHRETLTPLEAKHE